MKKILLLTFVFAIASTVTAQQLKTNTNIPSANYLKEASFKATNNNDNILRSSANNIFTEDFNGGTGQFTINTDPGSPVFWEHTTTGHVGQYPSQSLESTTSANGWMIADSDAFGSQGGAQEYTELISPIIDCSGYQNIVLQFEQYFRRYQNDTCLVMTSSDGGATWSGKYYINSAIGPNGWYATVDQGGTNNPNLKQVNLSSSIGGSSQAQFKFVWQGIWDYGWQIDDVALIEQPNNDLVLDAAVLNMSSNVSGNPNEWRDFYGHIPSNQVTNAEFGLQVTNFGVLPQTNVTTTYSDGTSSGTDSENNGTVQPDSTFLVYHANQYMPTTVGLHDFLFSVSADSTDNSPVNNELPVSLVITDTLFNAFGIGEKIGSSGTGYFTGGDDGFKMANMYELEVADELTSVTLGLRTNGSTDVGGMVQVTVFDTTGFFSAGIETPLMYSDFYFITADDTTTGLATIPMPTTYLGTPQDRNLNPGAYYVSVECYNSAGMNEIRVLDDLTYPYRSAWGSMIFIPGEQWYTNGEALWISANFGTWNPGTSNIDEIQSLSGHNAYPNPTTGRLEISYNLVDGGNMNIIVRDITGKIVLTKNEGELSLGLNKSNLNLSHLSEGIYTYELSINNESTFGKVVLTR